MQNNIFTDDFEFWVHGNETEENTAKLEQAIKYIAEHTDELCQEVFVDKFYNFYGIDKEKVSSITDIADNLKVETVVFCSEENIVTVIFSNENFMFGHYIEGRFDNDWQVVYREIC